MNSKCPYYAGKTFSVHSCCLFRYVVAAKLPSSKVVPAQMVLNSKAKDRKFECDFQFSQKTQSSATFYI